MASAPQLLEALKLAQQSLSECMAEVHRLNEQNRTTVFAGPVYKRADLAAYACKAAIEASEGLT